jgi:hypothetical protein
MFKTAISEHHHGVSPQPARDLVANAELSSDVFELPAGVGASVLGAHAETRPIEGGFDAREHSLGESGVDGVRDLAVGEGLLRSVGTRGTGEQMYALAPPGRRPVRASAHRRRPK